MDIGGIIMKKLIIAVSAASIIFTGALTAFAAAGNGNNGVCPYGYENRVNGYCNGENCQNNGERPLDGTGMKNGYRSGNNQKGRGMGRMMNNGVCSQI